MSERDAIKTVGGLLDELTKKGHLFDVPRSIAYDDIPLEMALRAMRRLETLLCYVKGDRDECPACDSLPSELAEAKGACPICRAEESLNEMAEYLGVEL